MDLNRLPSRTRHIKKGALESSAPAAELSRHQKSVRINAHCHAPSAPQDLHCSLVDRWKQSFRLLHCSSFVCWGGLSCAPRFEVRMEPNSLRRHCVNLRCPLRCPLLWQRRQGHCRWHCFGQRSQSWSWIWRSMDQQPPPLTIRFAAG